MAGAEGDLQEVTVSAVGRAGQHHVENSTAGAQGAESCVRIGVKTAINEAEFNLATVLALATAQMSAPTLEEVGRPPDIDHAIAVGSQGWNGKLEWNALTLVAVWRVEGNSLWRREPGGWQQDRIHASHPGYFCSSFPIGTDLLATSGDEAPCFDLPPATAWK